MRMIDKALARFGYFKSRGIDGGFTAGMVGRLTADWTRFTKSINYDLRKDLDRLKARSRDAVKNTDMGSAFLELCQQNIVGENGFTLQVRAKSPTGIFDKSANVKIEEGWESFCKVGNCDVTRQMSMQEMDDMVVASLVYDGEAIVRRVKGFKNTDRIAYQFVDSTLLDQNRNQERSNGRNEIRLGVEFNEWDEPVAYWFRQNGTAFGGTTVTFNYERLPAEQILHIFPKVFPGQARGIPWFAPVLFKQHMLGAYEEAEVIAARAAACKLGFITSPLGNEFKGEKDSKGKTQMDFEAGSMNQLSEGQEVHSWDPQHPNAGFGAFVTGVKQAISAGLKVAYSSLTGDLTKVNYSSIRAGLLPERSRWTRAQRFLEAHWKTPVFGDWLEVALTIGRVRLPLEKYDNFNKPKWTGKRWPWVDPMKDAEAVALQIENGTLSRTEVAAEQGKDFEDLMTQIAEEKKVMKEKGLDFGKQAKPKPNEPEKPAGGDDEPETT